MAGFLNQIEYHVTAVTFMVREIFLPPKKLLTETGIAKGFRVLDYGCGIGSHSVAAAKIVGSEGRVYATDISPTALRYVKKAIIKNRLENIEVIKTSCILNLPNDSMNVVLLYDVYHLLDKPQKVIGELHRVLKDDGILSFTDHHMKEEDIVLQLTMDCLLKFAYKGDRTHTFEKVKGF